MQQTCSNCQQLNRPEAKFCAHCRASLNTPTPTSMGVPIKPSAPSPKVPCPHCGQLINATAKFCNYCGQTTAVTPAPTTQPAPIAAPQVTPVTRPQQTVAAGPPAPESVAAPLPPPPYSPPAKPRRKGLTKNQAVALAGLSIVVVLVLIGGIVALGSRPNTVPAVNTTPAPIATVVVTLTLTITLPPPTATLSPTTEVLPTVQPLINSGRPNCPLPRPPSVRPYEIRSGDTLYDLASQFHIDLEDLYRLNRLPLGYSDIKLGDCIWVPQ